MSRGVEAVHPTAGTSPEVVLSVSELSTWFALRRFGVFRVGDVRAVDGVDFELRRGETTAFVGESGCGKSSLARTLLGLHRPTHGRVVFEGRDLATFGRAEWRAFRGRVGFVQQDPYGALAPFMDVRRILSEPLIVNGVRGRAERERRIREVLSEVRLLPVDDYLGKYPHMLSGGQQQRVVIARALILEPVLIIADEPVSMLDASVRVEILTLLREVQRARNLTLAFITHDLSTVRHFAERISVMYAGRIIEQGPVDDLLDDPKHPYTQALLAAIPDPLAENATHDRVLPGGEPPSLVNPPAGCHFHPRCPALIPGRCDRDVPTEVEPTAGHRVACWLHGPGTGA
ncbi:MAG: ABC transporter ATP-binding protein [Deltaproteobacteria bacterium]|nr:ABC transporter ATP-binding protein [Deltaproteobacteria bacterium]